MIKISCEKKENVIIRLTVKGHAYYAEESKDIVCASVSSMVICSVNAIISIDENALSYSIDDGFIDVSNIKDDNITQKIINNLFNMLKELEAEYPKNIKIKE